MNRETLQSVLEKCRLLDGTAWPMPVTLQLPMVYLKMAGAASSNLYMIAFKQVGMELLQNHTKTFDYPRHDYSGSERLRHLPYS